MTFYVMDTVENLPSWSAKTDAAESFTSLKAAEKRAKELAKYEPGKVFEVCQAIASVACDVGPAKITKR